MSARLGLLQRFNIRDWRTLSGLFFVSTLLEALAAAQLTAFTPLYLETELGLPREQVPVWTGLLTSLTFAVAFPLAPFWGSLAERYSRKLIIVRSMYIEAVGYVLCGLAADPYWFAAARALLGLTFGNVAVILATQSLLTPEHRIATAISRVQSTLPLAVSIGPPLGAALIPVIGLRGLFVLAGLACLLAGLLVTFLMPEPEGRNVSRSVLGNMKHAIGMVAGHPQVRLNFVAWYLTRGAQMVMDIYTPVKIGELVRGDPTPAIGLILGVYGALTTVATWITGRWVDRAGPARLFWPAMVLATVLALGIAVTPWLWLLAIFAWIRAIPLGLNHTTLYAHLSQVLRREERAPVMSLTPFPRNVSMFSLPLVAAAAAAFGTTPALLIGTGAYALAAWCGLAIREARKNEEAPS